MNKVQKNNENSIKKSNVRKKIMFVTLFAIIMYIIMSIFMISNAGIIESVGELFKPTPPENDPELKRISEMILGYIQAVAVAIFVGAIMYYGIIWVSADSEKKAEIKEKIVFWVLSGVFIFSATSVVKTIVKWGNEIDI